MNNVPPLKDNDDKRAEENMKSRIKDMFAQHEDFPAPMSMREMERLKNRVIELESALAQKTDSPQVDELEHKTEDTQPQAQPSVSPDTMPVETRRNVFQSVRSAFDRLSYPRKFIIIGLLFMLPLLVVYPLLKERIQNIESYGRQELRGSNYLQSLYHVLSSVQTYQIEITRYSLGELSPTDLQASATKVDTALEKLAQAHAQDGTALTLSDEPLQLEATWQDIKDGAAKNENISSQLAELVTNIQAQIFRVGNTSNLILDPDLDTYYTMDVTLLKLPENQSLLTQILLLSSEAARTHSLTPQQSAELNVLIGRYQSNIQAMKSSIDVALQNNASGTMRPFITSNLANYSDLTQQFLTTLDQQIIQASFINIDANTLLSDGLQVMEAQQHLFDGVMSALQTGINTRIQSQSNRLIYNIGFVILATLAAFAAGLSIMRRISIPLQSLTLAAQRLGAGETSARATVLSHDEVGQTAIAFNSMADRLGHTLGSLSARTRDLALAAEVGQFISQMRDIDNLLSSAVELIRSRFDLYYVQIYLLDQSQQSLAMRAGTGSVGEELLNRNFRLLVSTSSLNGRAVVETRAVIVSNTENTPSFRPNILLPKTRSEMCVPILAGGQVLGVLDLQSEFPNTFSEENLPVFNTLTGQLAIALQNAALFAQAEESRSELQGQVRSITEQGWQNFLNAIDRGHKIGFAYDRANLHPMSPDEIAQPTEKVFTTPISVTGATIGSIQFVDVSDQTLTEDEVEVIQATAQQLGQHVDNLRLLAQAEGYRAEAEAAIRRLTREGWDEYLERQKSESTAFAYNLNNVVPLENHDDNHQGASGVIQPLTVREEVIGELVVDANTESQGWMQDILSAISAQLSNHIDNLRLSSSNLVLLKSTEERAQREQILRQLTTALRSSTNPATILRTAARELGTILGRKTVVQVTTAETDNDSESTPAPDHVSAGQPQQA